MRLFGTASDEGEAKSHRSLVRLRLDNWALGSLKQLPAGEQICHPNVSNDKMPACPSGQPGRMVGSNLYLGFGPLGVGGLARPPAIASKDESALLRIAFAPGVSDTDVADIRKAMQFAAWFGTLGSRSRNGWGALQISGENLLGLDGLCDSALISIAPLRSLDEAMRCEWPHAVGAVSDGRPAVWRVYERKATIEGKTRFVGFDSWRGVMEKLAEVKIKIRTQFVLNSGEPHNDVEQRHVLAYPVTNHGLKGSKTKTMDGRLANQLRFKVAHVLRKDKHEFFGLIVHLPSEMPRAFFEGTIAQPPNRAFQAGVWRQVHDCLNTQFPQSIARIREA
jgi:CRISPR-associated protein Cmr1